MLDLTHTTKEHDESRQGEALLLEQDPILSNGRKLYIESYGCQMNFSDSEIVASILLDKGFETTKNYQEADVVFINTCSIRENAEQRVRNRLKEFEAAKAKKSRNDRWCAGLHGGAFEIEIFRGRKISGRCGRSRCLSRSTKFD